MCAITRVVWEVLSDRNIAGMLYTDGEASMQNLKELNFKKLCIKNIYLLSVQIRDACKTDLKLQDVSGEREHPLKITWSKE